MCPVHESAATGVLPASSLTRRAAGTHFFQIVAARVAKSESGTKPLVFGLVPPGWTPDDVCGGGLSAARSGEPR